MWYNLAMPELPEVETIKRGLEEHLIGQTIISLDVRWPKIISGDLEKLTGATITQLRRRGKGIIISLDNSYSIAVHVKMTGQFIYVDQETTKNFHPSRRVGESLPNSWTHLVFHLERKNTQHQATLYYNDVRKFGWLKVTPTDEINDLPFFKMLGPEPLTTLTIQQFTAILGKAKGPIKPLLMDQTKIAGIGNIYANDALFLARIHPQRPANSLTQKESRALFAAIESVLQKSIDLGGSTETNFVNALGGEGGYQNHFLIYKQAGKPCHNCGTEVKKIQLAGRGTFFCPTCQVPPI